MPVDDQPCDRLGDTWWDENSLLSLLCRGINPERFGYMRRLLAEEFARLGCRVTGADPSTQSLETARTHALAGAAIRS